jgi:large subunit ribosomal protein L25
MKTLEIIGYNRANLGKSESKKLRNEGSVPCVLYGGKEQRHFSVPMILFRDLIYTPEVCFINLNIEGENYNCVLQDAQFHPVSEIILHADFLQLFEEKPVRMDIPVRLVGVSPGVVNGGTLVHKRRTISIMALPKNMPEFVNVDIADLDFHKSIKVGLIEAVNFEILDPDQASIAVVEVPRALRAALDEEEEAALAEAEALEALEAEEGAEGEEGAKAPAAPAAGEEESDKES